MSDESLHLSDATGPNTVRFEVDLEPLSLRLTLIGVLFAAFIVGYIAVSAVFNAGTCNLLGVFGGLLLGAGAMQVTEKALKGRWKSDRFVTVDEDAIYVQDRKGKQHVINPDQQVNVLMWRFQTRRRSRIPKGWYVLALALEQDDNYLPVYAVSSPEDYESLPLSSQFTMLKPKSKTGDEPQNLRLAGQQRRLYTAEGARDLHGVEMTLDDFRRFIQTLQTRYPAWMPTK
jgi:hypothetical protein